MSHGVHFMYMLRFYVYLPEPLKNRIEQRAKITRRPKAHIVREALEQGLELTDPKSNSAEALLKFAKMAEKIPTKGKVPTDAVENMDFYTWGGRKRA